jgi:hypothetical protein
MTFVQSHVGKNVTIKFKNSKIFLSNIKLLKVVILYLFGGKEVAFLCLLPLIFCVVYKEWTCFAKIISTYPLLPEGGIDIS